MLFARGADAWFPCNLRDYGEQRVSINWEAPSDASLAPANRIPLGTPSFTQKRLLHYGNHEDTGNTNLIWTALERGTTGIGMVYEWLRYKMIYNQRQIGSGSCCVCYDWICSDGSKSQRMPQKRQFFQNASLRQPSSVSFSEIMTRHQRKSGQCVCPGCA